MREVILIIYALRLRIVNIRITSHGDNSSHVTKMSCSCLQNLSWFEKMVFLPTASGLPLMVVKVVMWLKCPVMFLFAKLAKSFLSPTTPFQLTFQKIHHWIKYHKVQIVLPSQTPLKMKIHGNISSEACNMSSQRQIWFLLSGQGGSHVLSQYIKVRPTGHARHRPVFHSWVSHHYTRQSKNCCL